MKHDTNYFPEVLDPEDTFDFVQVCQICKLESGTVISMVEEGVVEPIGKSIDDWVFSYSSVARVQKANRLQRDLDINLPGVALSIDLLEEIEDLRSRIRLLESRLDNT